MVTPFLLRPRPLEGESLSSWRQRVAWANGFRLFLLHQGVLRRSDPDLGLHHSEFDWIAATHGLAADSISGMTLRGMIGTIVYDVHSRQHPPWWLRAHYGASNRSFGAMFCPLCLGEDKVPYFRLEWRMGFNLVCPKHRVLYRDSCSACGARPWPGGCGGVEHLSRQFHSLDRCWRCGVNLSEQSTRQADLNSSCAEWLKSGYGVVAGKQVPCIELLSALRAMCQLFIRNKTRTLLIASGRWPAIDTIFRDRSDPANAVEYYCVADRYELIHAASDLLSDWPEKFLAVASEFGLSRSLFFGATHLHPSWVDIVINTSLAKQNRSITEEDVRRVVSELREAGKVVTKGAIWRKLDWQGQIDPKWLA